MTQSYITITETRELLRQLSVSHTEIEFDPGSQSVGFTDENDVRHIIRLPLVFPTLCAGTAQELLHQIDQLSQTVAVVLVQAGRAAVGIWENGVLTQHRVITKYMVRKCQGSSQLKHLKTKGKSRIGSRIRLQNSVAFFEEINEVLTLWKVDTRCETILMSLPVSLKQWLFHSEVPTPFGKKDARIKKIPMDVRPPSFEELQHVVWVTTRGSWSQHPGPST